jgi:hypothetical protein
MPQKQIDRHQQQKKVSTRLSNPTRQHCSEYVNVISVPAVFVAADTNEGTVVSTVELFVTLVDDNEDALFPAVSFTAFDPAGCV